MAEAKSSKEVDSKTAVPAVNNGVRDIEETINDSAVEKKRLEKVLDKTR